MKKYDVIGLMSGTSLDGLDIANVRFFHDKEWRFEIIKCKAIGYSKELCSDLYKANQLSALALKKLDIAYGLWVGNNVKEFMDSGGFSVELIVSHGHTIFHQPEIGLTHQIGDGYEIMRATETRTICDLRSLDVSLGGQGAPLVPIGDLLLFGEYDFCLNLGGFSNISFDKADSRIAFDICPVNTVLNKLASKLSLEYDDGGKIAKSGKINPQLIQKLNALDYYKKRPPKSLGIEWVNEHVFPLLDNDSPENLMTTVCYHIAHQISDSIKNSKIRITKSQIPKVLVTGGGAKNTFLMNLIKNQTKGHADIVIPNKQIVDFKEAIIFAFIGLLRMLGQTNTLKSVTGAVADCSGGLIYENFNYLK